MKDAKGHGSDSRGAHAAGVDQVGQWGTNPQRNMEYARQWFERAGVKTDIEDDKKGVPMGVGKDTVYFNPKADFWKDPIKSQADQGAVRGRMNPLASRLNNNGLFFTGSHHSSTDPEGRLHHEHAHVLFDAPSKFASPADRQTALKVSGYATKSPGEFVAETHAGLKTGKQYPDDVMKLFHQYAKPRRAG